MPTYRLTLEYDGSDFHGWQRQPGLRTVEGEVLRAVASVTGETAELTAAGRTDAGAHSHGQVVGCTLGRPWVGERLREALNAVLPRDVAVSAVEDAPEGFHARHDARSRMYRYVVVPRRSRAPLARRYAWYVRGPLDLDAMRRAADRLRGTHDFGAFGRSPRPGGSTVRTISEIAVRRASGIGGGEGVDAILIDVVADAFLFGMMRSIAAALVAVGSGRLDASDLAVALTHPTAGRIRPAAAPAHGLHQWTVIYPDALRGGDAVRVSSEQQ